MKPISASVEVPFERQQVYEYLDVLANHEPFNDHLLVEWSYSGPPRGVGAAARMRIKRPGRADWVELEVIEAEPPRRQVERSVSAGGRRVSRGIYEFATVASGTRITFTFELESAPTFERLLGPVGRLAMTSAVRKSMRRLADQMQMQPVSEGRSGEPASP